MRHSYVLFGYCAAVIASLVLLCSSLFVAPAQAQPLDKGTVVSAAGGGSDSQSPLQSIVASFESIPVPGLSKVPSQSAFNNVMADNGYTVQSNADTSGMKGVRSSAMAIQANGGNAAVFLQFDSKSDLTASQSGANALLTTWASKGSANIKSEKRSGSATITEYSGSGIVVYVAVEDTTMVIGAVTGSSDQVDTLLSSMGFEQSVAERAARAVLAVVLVALLVVVVLKIVRRASASGAQRADIYQARAVNTFEDTGDFVGNRQFAPEVNDSTAVQRQQYMATQGLRPLSDSPLMTVGEEFLPDPVLLEQGTDLARKRAEGKDSYTLSNAATGISVDSAELAQAHINASANAFAPSREFLPASYAAAAPVAAAQPAPMQTTPAPVVQPQVAAVQAVPAQAAPAQAAPVQVTPAQPAPAQVAPVQAVPAQVVPAQAAPVQVNPAQTAPAHVIAAQEAPIHAIQAQASVQSAQTSAVPAHAIPAQSAPAQVVAGDAAAMETAAHAVPAAAGPAPTVHAETAAAQAVPAHPAPMAVPAPISVSAPVSAQSAPVAAAPVASSAPSLASAPVFAQAPVVSAQHQVPMPAQAIGGSQTFSAPRAQAPVLSAPILAMQAAPVPVAVPAVPSHPVAQAHPAAPAVAQPSASAAQASASAVATPPVLSSPVATPPVPVPPATFSQAAAPSVAHTSDSPSAPVLSASQRPVAEPVSAVAASSPASAAQPVTVAVSSPVPAPQPVTAVTPSPASAAQPMQIAAPSSESAAAQATPLMSEAPAMWGREEQHLVQHGEEFGKLPVNASGANASGANASAAGNAVPTPAFSTTPMPVRTPILQTAEAMSPMPAASASIPSTSAPSVPDASAFATPNPQESSVQPIAEKEPAPVVSDPLFGTAPGQVFIPPALRGKVDAMHSAFVTPLPKPVTPVAANAIKSDQSESAEDPSSNDAHVEDGEFGTSRKDRKTLVEIAKKKSTKKSIYKLKGVYFPGMA